MTKREILFRGKRTDNGEWVYGSPIFQDGWGLIRFWNGEEFQFEEHLVAPKSISEYTGLTDKTGKKIFEGDVLKTQLFYDRPYSDKRKSKQFIGVVEYKIRTFNGNRFYAKQNYQAEWGLKFYKDFGKYTHYSWGELWDCEVIGNIHDDPELLKEGADNG